MSEQQWREITLEDLREMSTAEQKRCRVRIGDVTRDVFDVDEDEIVYTVLGGCVQDWTDYELDHWDATIEAPVPPPHPLPTHEGAVIRVGGRVVVRFATGWYAAGGVGPVHSDDGVQRWADGYGWVELVPVNTPDAEDARAAGIREVEADFRAQHLFNTAARLRGRFPEAFSDAVNTKETDDEC